MNTSFTTFIRGFIGFIVGSIVAPVASGIAFVAIYPAPPEVPQEPDYYPYALLSIVVATFICGGLIGLRGFTTGSASGLLWPVIGSYAFMLFLSVSKELSFYEAAPLIAFASVGIAVAVGACLAVLRWFPRNGLHDVV